MSAELAPLTGYFNTSEHPDRRHAELEEHRELWDAAMATFFKACRRRGRPYIDFHPGSGIFRYVYFDRSRPPSSELMDQLGTLAWSFGLIHHHVLKGDVFRECLDSRYALAHQGRFTGSSRDWSPEQAEAFVSQLSRLLPAFDRPAAVKSLTEKAISAGYFTYTADWPFGDEDLERDAQEAYEDWRKTQGRPLVTLNLEDANFSYEVPGEILDDQAVTAIDSLARSAGFGNEYGPNGIGYLEVLGNDAPPIFAHPDQVPPFVARLTGILTDARSHGRAAE